MKIILLNLIWYIDVFHGNYLGQILQWSDKPQFGCEFGAEINEVICKENVAWKILVTKVHQSGGTPHPLQLPQFDLRNIYSIARDQTKGEISL